MPDAPATPAGEDDEQTPAANLSIDDAVDAPHPLPVHPESAAEGANEAPNTPLSSRSGRGAGGEGEQPLDSSSESSGEQRPLPAADEQSSDSPFFSWGYPGAPVVLAIHDVGQDLRMWATLGDRLADAYHLFAIDLPGHGAEEDPPFQWSVGDAAASVIDALAAEHVEIVALVGSGLGARIAIEVAAQQPSLVAAMVLAELPMDPSTTADISTLVERRGPVELGRRTAADVGDGFLRRAIRERYARLSRDGMLAALRALTDAGPIDSGSLAGFRAPVLVCSAQEHPALVSCRSFTRALPASRHLTFRDCESAALGRPGEFAEQVFRFLRAVEEGENISGERTI